MHIANCMTLFKKILKYTQNYNSTLQKLVMFSIFLSWYLFLDKVKLCIRRLFNNTNVRISNDDEALKSLFQNKKPGKNSQLI